MKVVTLIENSEGVKNCAFEHGLSIYVEMEKHKLLLDTGASGDFIKNAAVLGIDLTLVDAVILSHGHWDHAGGILPFAELNDRAEIYAQITAGFDYYNGDNYIGIDKRILELPQLRLRRGDYRICEGVTVFTGVDERRCWPKGNRAMTCRTNGKNVRDNFDHEQYLVLEEKGARILLSGCAHNGILNIMKKFSALFGGEPDIVISGFHMMKQSEYDEDDITMIKDTARELAKTKSIFYTGHCTSEQAFVIMKEIMGQQLQPLYTGKIIC